MKFPAIHLLSLSASLLAACAGGGGMPGRSYAQFEPVKQAMDSDTRPAFVLEIDGEKQSIDRSDPVLPGVRKLVVSVPAGRGVGLGYGGSRQQTVTIDAKPCVRYYLAARRSSERQQDWSAFVAGTEPISGCRPGD